MYSCDGKAELSSAITPVSNAGSEIICWFGSEEIFVISNIENSLLLYIFVQTMLHIIQDSMVTCNQFNASLMNESIHIWSHFSLEAHSY